MEQRLNFSDYSAEEQEKDAKRIRYKEPPRHAYLLKIDGTWVHYIVNQLGDKYKFYDDLNLPQVYKEMKKNLPEYKPVVIQNDGLAEYLRGKKRYKQLNLFKKSGYEK